MVLEKFISEELFYDSYAIKLKNADTITIIDKTGKLGQCNGISCRGKLVNVIENKDFIIQLNFLKKDQDAYEHTIVIENMVVKDNLFKMYFFKLVSNFDGYFEYKVNSDTSIERIDYQYGRY